MYRQNSNFQISIVVPCFNETARIDLSQFSDFAAKHPNFSFLFVNDGSTDATPHLLQEHQTEHPEWCQFLDLATNQGKAEAVRRGVLLASVSGADAIGYFDADLATPLDALPRMVEVLRRRPETHLVMGTRIRLQGHHIERKRTRRILGRSFALAASWTLGLSIVDTQCGAKLFRTTPHIEALFSSPFRSRWIFDVEILARLYQLVGREPAARQLYALPLEAWREVPGSKLKSTDFFRAVGELVGNFWEYRVRPSLFNRTSTAASSPQPTSHQATANEDGKEKRRAA